MAGSLPLLTKIQPPGRRADALRRQRLLDALLENSDRKLLLVVAPAGYGKTTALADLVEQSPLPVAWLTLDPADRDPRSFVEYLIRAVRHVAPRFGEAALAALTGAPEKESRAGELARAVAADLHANLPNVTLLVLDDFHEVNESPAVTAFLDELLRVLPDNLRVLLSGRTLPNLTVSRLVLDNELFGLSDPDLRFTVPEVAALLGQRYGVDVDERQAAAVAEKTEGWIAGLLLSLHGLDGAAGGPARLGIGPSEPLHQYLADEAYDRQPTAMRQFLLVSSTLRTLTEDSARALLGPGDWLGMLRDAERANLFIARLGGPQDAYRYHQLFREFLQSRLRREQPAQFRALHLRAAAHRVAARDWPGAIEHYHEAGAYDEAARLIARIAPQLEREGRWYLLARTIDELPEELRGRDGRLQLARARAAALTGDLKGAEIAARRAAALCESEGNTPGRAWALEVLGNALRRLGRTAEAVETLEAARDLAGTDEDLLASVRRDLAGCHGVRGDFQAAHADFCAAYDYFEAAGNSYEAARAAYGAGLALARLGRTDEACIRYDDALARWRAAGDLGSAAMVLNNLGYTRGCQGEYARARELLDEGLAWAQATGHRFAEASIYDSLGTLLLSQGDMAGAASSFRTGLEIAQDAGDLWTASAAMQGTGLCALLEGDDRAATEWLDRGAVLAERQQSDHRRALITVDRGLVLLRAGRIGQALATLTAAEEELVRLGARRDLVRAHAWIAHAHARRGDATSAGRYFRAAAEEAVALNVPALLDLPARFDEAAFARFRAGEFAEVRDAVLARVRGTPPSGAAPLGRAAAPRYHVRSFGRARVLDERGDTVAWGRGKARELFFYLVHTGVARSSRAVADLWPETPPPQAKASLYSAVYAARRATHREAVHAADRAYSVPAEAIATHDAAEFDRLYDAIRGERDEARRLALIEQLVALYEGPLLDDIEAEWAIAPRRAYEVRFLETLEALVAAYAERSDWDACLGAALRGIEADRHGRMFYEAGVLAYRKLGKLRAAQRLARRAAARGAGRG